MIPPNITDNCLERFREPNGFEPAMAMLAALDTSSYGPFVRNMAKFFANFFPDDDNLYITLFRQLIGLRAKFLVTTLNYENLIEHSLIAEPAVANDQAFFAGGELAGYRVHPIRAAAGHDDRRLRVIDAFEDARNILHHVAKLLRHVIDRAIRIDDGVFA